MAYSLTRLVSAGDASDWLALKPSTTARSIRLCNVLQATLTCYIYDNLTKKSLKNTKCCTHLMSRLLRIRNMPHSRS